jgi:hypothetical protein
MRLAEIALKLDRKAVYLASKSPLPLDLEELTKAEQKSFKNTERITEFVQTADVDKLIEVVR